MGDVGLMGTILRAETAKYDEVWTVPGYAKHSPGGTMAADLLGILRPPVGSSFVDLGCGAGAGGIEIQKLCPNSSVTYLDMVRVKGVPEPFVQQPLWAPLRDPDGAHAHWDYGYCCDVMEHIPEPFTMLVVDNILQSVGSGIFNISFSTDAFGAYVRQQLHLTIKPFTWWRDNLSEISTILSARDLLGHGVFWLQGREDA